MNLKLILPFVLFFSITIWSIVITDRFQLLDFEVYYKAGQRISQGIHPYQQRSDGHFIYKYSPVFALFVSPITIVHIECAKWIYSVLLFFIFTCTTLMLNKTLREKTSSAWLGFFLMIIFSKHLNKEIVLGQINILLLGLLAFTVYFSETKKWLSSLLLAFSIFIKPIGIVLLPYFIYRKNVLWLRNFFIVISIIFITSLFFVNINLYTCWFTELKNELHSKTDLYSIDTQTIFGFIQRILNINKPFNFFVGIALWILIQGMLYHFESAKYLYFLIATIPLLTCTSNNFYILSLPLFIHLINTWNKFTFLEKLSFIISSLLMCCNQYELWGRKGVDGIDYFTPYTLSLLIGCMTLVSVKMKQAKNLRQT